MPIDNATLAKPQPILYLDDHRGIYIPRDFVLGTRPECISGAKPEDLEILRDPNHEWYWEAWDSVCQNAILTDNLGTRYRLYQDGALWLIPEGSNWPEPEDDDDEEEV